VDDLQTVIVLNSVIRLSPGSEQIWCNTLDVFNKHPIQFFHDVSFTTGYPRPSYVCFVSWYLQVVSAYTTSFLERAVFFRPCLPLVAFHTLMRQILPSEAHVGGTVKTYIWDFGSSLKDSKHLQRPLIPDLRVIYDGLLDSLNFSSDGEFILGEDSKTGDPVTIKLDNFLKKKQLNIQDDHQDLSVHSFNSELQGTARKRTFEHLISLCDKKPISAVQHTGSLTFSRNSDGIALISN
jgi:hypothetical protein